MTRKQKIDTATKLLKGEGEPELKVYTIIVRNGIESCTDPDWPDNLSTNRICVRIKVIGNDIADEI